MYGGVAKSYVNWKILCEPYRENRVYYVNVEHPIRHTPKKVRWYTDNEHASMMPGFSPAAPIWSIFGFDSVDDKIKVIKVCDLTPEEEEKYFKSNWEKSTNADHWRKGAFFENENNEGCWYANQRADDFPIIHKDKVFLCDWETFHAEGQKHNKKIQGFTKFWDQEVA